MAGDGVLFTAGEALWPAMHGGRIRAAHLVEELARQLPVCVAAPVEAAPPIDVCLHPLPEVASVPRGLKAALRPSPRLGQALLGPHRARVVSEAAVRHRPALVCFAHGYLAAMAPELTAPAVVDFADVEVRRMASLARRGSVRSRVSAALEAGKARRWEPAVARRALLVTAPSLADVALLTSWGAQAVLVPNGTDRSPSLPSPADGPVTFVASFGYAPNRDAAAFLVEDVWPRLRRAEPGLRVRLVGRDADRALRQWRGLDGIEVVSDPESIDGWYREASLVVAPVRSGGGAQLKVTEALAAGRVLVATPYSAAAAAPPASREGVVVAEGGEHFADVVLALWRNAGERRRRERALMAGHGVPSWREACRPLVDALQCAAVRR